MQWQVRAVAVDGLGEVVAESLAVLDALDVAHNVHVWRHVDVGLAGSAGVVCLVGKTHDFHVATALGITLEENLDSIRASIAHTVAQGREALFDAEHFFDGYRANPGYARDCLKTAVEAGARWIVLCDTNGGTLPAEIHAVTSAVIAAGIPGDRLGIHTHNDGGLAVANAMAAVRAGCVQVQGTINGYGERCGNMDLVPLIANLQLKLGYDVVAAEQLGRLTEVSHFVADLVNLNPDAHAPYVGRSAFAHKGGIHVAAVHKFASSYEHIDPALVGNETRVVVSELAGRRNVRIRAEAMGLDLEGRDRAVLTRIKELESEGFQFEAADGSFEMLVRRMAPEYRPPFALLDYHVMVDKQGEDAARVQAMVKVRVGSDVMHTAADGSGPVEAMDEAIRKALLPHFPELAGVHLVDYKVRIIDAHLGVAARPRVVIESAAGETRWSTVGCSPNIIEASWQALWDALELPLLRAREGTVVEAAAG